MTVRTGTGQDATFLSATKPDKKICLGPDKIFCLATKYYRYCFLPDKNFYLGRSSSFLRLSVFFRSSSYFEVVFIVEVEDNHPHLCIKDNNFRQRWLSIYNCIMQRASYIKHNATCIMYHISSLMYNIM